MSAAIVPVFPRTDEGGRWWILISAWIFASLLSAEYIGSIAAILVCLAIVPAVAIFDLDGLFRWNPRDAGFLVAILVVGMAGLIFRGAATTPWSQFDLRRDIGIVLTYIVMLAVGQIASGNPRSRRLLLKAIVSAGVCISIVHLTLFTIALSSGVSDLNQLRLEAGRGSFTQFAAVMSLILIRRERDLRRGYHAPGTLLLYVVLLGSILASLSRGLLLSLIALLLIILVTKVDGFRGRISLTVLKLVAVVPSALIGLWVSYLLSSLLVPSIFGFIDEFFVSKVLNSWSEVTDGVANTRAQIAANYRAFESARALDQFDMAGAVPQWFGQGWGTAVNLRTETAATTSDFSRTQAPFLHNGYLYFLTKAGYIGLLFYVLFLANLIRHSLASVSNKYEGRSPLDNRICIVAVVCIGLGTLTTGGLGYPVSYAGLVLVVGICSPLTLLR